MQSFETSLNNINKILKILGGIFENNEIENKLELIIKETSKDSFWKDQKKVKKTLKEKNFYSNLISSYKNIDKDFKNLKDLFSLGNEENDEEIINDCTLKISELLKEIKKLEVACFLSGENDALNIYLEVHAGAGGTESQDWAEMLRRMYTKWFDKKKICL